MPFVGLDRDLATTRRSTGAGVLEAMILSGYSLARDPSQRIDASQKCLSAPQQPSSLCRQNQGQLRKAL